MMNVKRIFISSLLFLILCQGCINNSESTLTTREILHRQTSTLNNILQTNSKPLSKTTSLTPTYTIYNSPTYKITPLPQVDLSDVPPYIIEQANNISVNPSDIAYLYNLIKRVAEKRDPYLLFDFLQLPLHEQNRCPGKIIKTYEEFVGLFPILFDEVTLQNIINMTWDDVFISYRGILFAVNRKFDIGFMPYCVDHECREPLHWILEGLFDYTTYWEMVEGEPTPQPTYDPNFIKLGVYNATKQYIAYGEYKTLDETYNEWKKFVITITKYQLSLGPFPLELILPYVNEYEYCPYKIMEICPPTDNDLVGDYSLGKVQFICTNSQRIFDFYILDEDRLGMEMWNYSEGKYLVLKFSNN